MQVCVRQDIQHKTYAKLTITRQITRPMNLIPHQSRPRLTVTAISTVGIQDAHGNWATVGQEKKGGRCVHRQKEKRKKQETMAESRDFECWDYDRKCLRVR